MDVCDLGRRRRWLGDRGPQASKPTRSILRRRERSRAARSGQPTGIVVGIGDSGHGHYRAALDLAARMSRQRELTITLVHGCLPRLSITPSRSEALKRHLSPRPAAAPGGRTGAVPDG